MRGWIHTNADTQTGTHTQPQTCTDNRKITCYFMNLRNNLSISDYALIVFCVDLSALHSSHSITKRITYQNLARQGILNDRQSSFTNLEIVSYELSSSIASTPRCLGFFVQDERESGRVREGKKKRKMGKDEEKKKKSNNDPWNIHSSISKTTKRNGSVNRRRQQNYQVDRKQTQEAASQSLT